MSFLSITSRFLSVFWSFDAALSLLAINSRILEITMLLSPPCPNRCGAKWKCMGPTAIWARGGDSSDYHLIFTGNFPNLLLIAYMPCILHAFGRVLRNTGTFQRFVSQAESQAESQADLGNRTLCLPFKNTAPPPTASLWEILSISTKGAKLLPQHSVPSPDPYWRLIISKTKQLVVKFCKI